MIGWQTLVVVMAAVLVNYYFREEIPPTSIVREYTDSEYDYVIIGGGTAGCVLAARLAEDPTNKVLLLEAGASPENKFIFEAPLAYNQTWGRDNEWGYRTETRLDIYKGLRQNQGLLLKGKVLGGSGIMGMMEYSRGNSFDFTTWEEQHDCKGWGSEEVFLYLSKLEDNLIGRHHTSGFRESGGPMAVTEGRLSAVGDMFLQAGLEMGYEITDTNSDIGIGFDRYQYSVRDGIRSSTATEYLFKKGKRDNLHVSTESFVEKIDIQNKQAVGVVYINTAKRRYVRAKKEVILSAGVINSPQILLLSGIGPKIHLQQNGIKVLADLPVGDNLHDHVSLMLLSYVNEGLTVTEEMIEGLIGQNSYKYFKTGSWAHPSTEGNAMLQFERSDKDVAPDIQLLLRPKLESLSDNAINCNDSFCEEYLYKHGETPGITMLVNLLHPKSRGTVRLTSTDPYDLPTVNLQQLTVKDDMNGLIKGIRLWEQFTKTETMKKAGIDIEPTKVSFCLDNKYNTDAYWECFIRHFAFPAHNTVGTCKMGAADDKSAVVDPELRVRGIKGLRVIDASIIPAVTSGGTNIPTIMVAEKGADLIRGQRYNMTVPWSSLI